MEQSRVVRLCLLLVAFFALSCTREQKSATVTFTAPKFTQAQKLTYAKVDPATIHRLSDSGTNFNSLLNPTVTTDLNCFVVFVGGDGFDQAGTCTVSDGSSFKLGAYAGGVLSGGTATVTDVIAGTRTITLVGFHASDTVYCTDFHLGINQSQLSEPFIVAQKKMDVQASSSPINVDMTASLTTAKISDCHFANDSGGGGTGYFGTGADGDITSGSGALSLSSMMDASNQHYLTSVSHVTSILDNTNGTAKITVNQGWNSSTKINVTDGDEVMLYVSGASGGSPNGCGGQGTNDSTDGVYSGFSYSGRVSGTSTGGTGNTFNLDLGDPRWLNIPVANLTASGVGTGSQTFCHVLAVRVPQLNSINIPASSNLGLWQSNSGIYDINATDQTTAGLLPIRVKNGITLGNAATLSFVADGAGYHGGTTSAPTAPTGQSALGLITVSSPLPYFDQGGGVYSSIGCGGGHGGIGGCGDPSSAGQTESDDHGCGENAPLNPACLLGKFFFGGGGGSGGGSAGNGGGALRIFTSQISLGSASVLSFSANGTAGGASTADGGGAGGSILVSTNAIIGPADSNLGFKAIGGNGGNSGAGNGGGGGRIHVISQNMSAWLGTLTGNVSGGSGLVAGVSGTCYSSGMTLVCTAP